MVSFLQPLPDHFALAPGWQTTIDGKSHPVSPASKGGASQVLQDAAFQFSLVF